MENNNQSLDSFELIHENVEMITEIIKKYLMDVNYDEETELEIIEDSLKYEEKILSDSVLNEWNVIEVIQKK